MAEHCDHDWTWECPPLGPDWASCRRCATVKIECEFCRAEFALPRRKCPACGRFRTGRGLFKMLAGPAD